MPRQKRIAAHQSCPSTIVEQPQGGSCFDLSIVVISYSTIEMTRECLASIARFSGDLSVQTIVVDNNSLDGSVSMIKSEFPEIVLIENLENKGFAAANNQGFARCRGKYVLLLNSDTVILGSVLKDSVDFLSSHPDVGAMGCQVLNPDHSIQRTCSGFPTLFRLFIMTLALDRIRGLKFLDSYLMRWWSRDNEREVGVISGCYLMIRKEVLAEVGLLDERFFFFGEETDWCRRIREAGWKLNFAPVGKIIHYGGGSVKKLNYNRDVMLTAATVRLHRKHGGNIAAISAYLILMLFNLSRAVVWGFGSLFARQYKPRASHFFNVVRAYRACWPDL